MELRTRLLYVAMFLASACTQEKKTATTENKTSPAPTTSSEKSYRIVSGNLALEVDPKVGGRISSLTIHGKEVLYVNKETNNWGSTLWPSPQTLWNWPPVAVLDSEAYRDTVSEQGFAIVSKVAAKPAVSFTKQFVAQPQDSSFLLTYTITNQSDSSIRLAPWEITRVPSGGLIFYPTGKDKPQGDLKAQAQQLGGITWFDYDSTAIPQGVPKLFADGSKGWLAYVTNEHTLLVKKFKDTPIEEKAPSPENEIELFTDPARAYTEVEQQGAYTLVQPKASVSWTVQWFVRTIPQQVKIKAGDKELVRFVEAVVH